MLSSFTDIAVSVPIQRSYKHMGETITSAIKIDGIFCIVIWYLNVVQKGRKMYCIPLTLLSSGHDENLEEEIVALAIHSAEATALLFCV